MAGCGGSFGTMALGAGPFGTGSTLEVTSVTQEALNTAIVTFSVPPRLFDPGAIDDALNPANWTLSVRSPFDAELRLVQSVERIDALTARVLFDGPLTAPAVYRLALAARVRSVAGAAVSTACAALDFATVAPTRLQPLARVDDRTDLNNPYRIADAELLDPPPLGTFQINDRGDYALERGRPYLRKRVLRRASTLQGEFFHLPGYGFAEPQKSVVRGDLLRRLQSRAQAQIAREPDVLAVSVSARFASPTRNDVVILEIQVQDRYGRTEELTVPVTVRSPD